MADGFVRRMAKGTKDLSKSRKAKSGRGDLDTAVRHRIDRVSKTTMQSAWRKPRQSFRETITKGARVNCGWGNVLFGHTYEDLNDLKDDICDESKNTRNIALYLRDPHVLISLAPQEIFLDPSHTYRIWFERYQSAKKPLKNLVIRRAEKASDLREINLILEKRGMVPLAKDFKAAQLKTNKIIFFIAEDRKTSSPLGLVMGIDHAEVFEDPEQGTSLWTLAIHPNAKLPGLGEALVRHLIEYYIARGRDYLDLSVMHNNASAIRLYEKLGFERIPVFCVKSKNAINEPLFIAPTQKEDLNPYADIIIREARRRGISVEVLDKNFAIFDLSFGGRTITCQESLTELTSAIAFLRCSHKPTTLGVLKKAGLKVPAQEIFSTMKKAEDFLAKHKRVVVKPEVGEQGHGVSVDISSKTELHSAINRLKTTGEKIILEKFVTGTDLRIVVIDYQVVAASYRKPPAIIGDGSSSLKSLITKQNRRLQAATGGESKIPIDEELHRCLKSFGYKLETVVPNGEEVVVRKTPNLHTGGSLHDVTDLLHPVLKEAAERAAAALKIPVVGLDLIVNDVTKPQYVFIEANERPGLANHEPQPTAEKFLDLLFPQTKV